MHISNMDITVGDQRMKEDKITMNLGVNDSDWLEHPIKSASNQFISVLLVATSKSPIQPQAFQTTPAIADAGR